RQSLSTLFPTRRSSDLGSEGTLAFITSAKIKLSKIDPPHKKLVCIHCLSIDESLHANLVALQYRPSAVELMDHYVFEATKRNRGDRKSTRLNSSHVKIT